MYFPFFPVQLLGGNTSNHPSTNYPLCCTQIVFAQPTYWYIASSADHAFTSTFIARLVLHLRGVASPSFDTTYTYTDAYPSRVNGANTAPKILTTVADQEQNIPEPHLDVHQLTHQHSHDGENTLGEHSVSDEQWRHREGDAVEMDVRVEQKTSPVSKIFGDRCHWSNA